MTLDDLHQLIDDAQWFTQLGSPFDGCILAASTDGWDWLPTSRDQCDPIHGGALPVRDTAAEVAAVKRTLVSLRPVSDSVTSSVDGPHNYTNAAKGGAQFAVRFAVREICNDAEDFWCDIVRLFNHGRWPCGLADDGVIVVW